MVLQFKNDRYADLGAAGLGILLTGMPLGHHFQYAHGLVGKTGIDRLQYLDIADAAIGVDDELCQNLALNASLLSRGG